MNRLALEFLAVGLGLVLGYEVWAMIDPVALTVSEMVWEFYLSNGWAAGLSVALWGWLTWHFWVEPLWRGRRGA